MTPREIELARDELFVRQRVLKNALDAAKDPKEKDRLRKVMDDFEKEKAEWKKKGV